jgi:hypothetical protein
VSDEFAEFEATEAEIDSMMAEGEPIRPQGLIEGSGRRGDPRSLGQIVSVRMDGETLARIRELAGQDGAKVSEWIRRAARAEVFRRQQPVSPPGAPRICGWSCQHMSMTTLAGTLGKPVMWCGCEMQPIYETAA